MGSPSLVADHAVELKGILPSQSMKEYKAERWQLGNRFIVGGSAILADCVRSAIKKNVEEEFKEQLLRAKWLERWRLRKQVRSEIERRAAKEIAKQMPSSDTLW